MTYEQIIAKALEVLNEMIEQAKRDALKELIDAIRPWLPPGLVPYFGTVTSSNPTEAQIEELASAQCDEIAQAVHDDAQQRMQGGN